MGVERKYTVKRVYKRYKVFPDGLDTFSSRNALGKYNFQLCRGDWWLSERVLRLLDGGFLMGFLRGEDFLLSVP